MERVAETLDMTNKPHIKVHGTDVDFGQVRFHVDVHSDYTHSSIEVIDTEHLTDRAKQKLIKEAMPWIKAVLNFTVGSWGDASFRASGMVLVDEVAEDSGYWTYPAGGSFREDAKLPKRFISHIPRQVEFTLTEDDGTF